MEVLLQVGAPLLEVVEVAGCDFVELHCPKCGNQLRLQLVPCADVTIREVGVPVLCEFIQGMDKGFSFACEAPSGCLDGGFVLEKELSRVRLSVILRKDCRVESRWPLELFELRGERGAEASVGPSLLLLYHFCTRLLLRLSTYLRRG